MADDLQQLAADMAKAAARAPKESAAVVAKGALNIKRDAAQRISGHPHAPAYPSSISYDLFILLGSTQAEIGPDKSRRQGALGNILEYGTSKNAPIPHLEPALRAEEPRFVKAMEDLAGKLL